MKYQPAKTLLNQLFSPPIFLRLIAPEMAVDVWDG